MAVRGRGGEGLEVIRHKVTVTREDTSSGQGEGLQAVLEQERWEEELMYLMCLMCLMCLMYLMYLMFSL